MSQSPEPQTIAAPAVEGRLFYGWRVVAAAALGMMLGSTALPQFTLGVMFDPLANEFGWSRTALTSVFAVFVLSGVVMAPIAGSVVDRYGARRLIVGSCLAMSAVFFALSMLPNSIAALRIAYMLIAVLGAGTSSIVYTRLIAVWFTRRRGLTLGLALTGPGLANALLPFFVSVVIEQVGWRQAYVVLAMLVLVALPLALFVLRDTPQSMGLLPDGDTGPSADEIAGMPIGGDTLRQAAGQRSFQLIAVSFFLLGIGLLPIGVLMVPIMTDSGFEPRVAALVAGTAGTFTIIGRFFMAFLLDRVFAPPIAGLILFATAAAVAAIGSEPPLALAFVGAAMVGIAAGAEIDLLAYCTARYFGLAHFGRIYGILFSCFTLGGAIGAIGQGVLFDAAGDYGQGTRIATVLISVSAVLLLLLPRYRLTPGGAH